MPTYLLFREPGEVSDEVHGQGLHRPLPVPCLRPAGA